MATLSSVLAWRILGTGEPGGLPSMGSHRVGHDYSDLAARETMGKNKKEKLSKEKQPRVQHVAPTLRNLSDFRQYFRNKASSIYGFNPRLICSFACTLFLILENTCFKNAPKLFCCIAKSLLYIRKTFRMKLVHLC